MKKLLTILIIIALGISSGLAVAGTPVLSFGPMNSVTNSSAKDFAVSAKDYWCEITNRTGTDEIIVTIQGTNLTSDSTWVNMVSNKTIANAADSSWQFQSLDYYARKVRVSVKTEADVANTISGKCAQGGR